MKEPRAEKNSNGCLYVVITILLIPLVVQVVGGWILNYLPSFPWPFHVEATPTPKSCPQELTEAHQILADTGRDPAPQDVNHNVTPSQAFPGRIRVTFGWINEVGISRAGIAISGVYGEPNPGDDFISVEQTSAATGECWNWYRYIHRNGAQPEVANTEIDGLWPNQQYCYFASYEGDDRSGWSKLTDITCFDVTWYDDWGKPTYPPQR